MSLWLLLLINALIIGLGFETIYWPKSNTNRFDWNDSIFTCYQGDISVGLNLKKLFYEDPGIGQISKR